MRRRVVVRADVAGGRAEDDPGLPGGGDRVAQRLRVRLASPGGVHGDDVHSMLLLPDGVGDGRDGSGDLPAAVVLHDPERHDPRLPADPGDTGRVVADRRHGAGDVRTVAEKRAVVDGVRVVVGRVDAVEVVDVAVAVVVDPGRASPLQRVVPHVGGEVLVGVVDAGVENGHDDRGRSRGEIPGRGGGDLGQAPERAPQGVVRDRVRPQDVVGFRIDDAWVLLECGHQFAGRERRGAHDEGGRRRRHGRRRQLATGGDPGGADGRSNDRRTRAGAQLHDRLTRRPTDTDRGTGGRRRRGRTARERRRHGCDEEDEQDECRAEDAGDRRGPGVPSRLADAWLHVAPTDRQAPRTGFYACPGCRPKRRGRDGVHKPGRRTLPVY